MNEKYIKKKIKEYFLSQTPDVLDRIDLDYIQIEKSKRPFSWGNVFLKRSLATAFAFLIGFLIFSIHIGNNPTESNGVFVESSSSMNELAFSTLSSLTILELSFNDDESENLLFLNATKNIKNKNVKDDIMFIFPLMEVFSENKNSFKIEITESALDDFEFEMSLTFKTMFENENAFTLHFNETKNKTDGEDQEITIEGIAFFEDKIFTFESEYEYNKDSKSFEMEFFNQYDDSVKIEYETEWELNGEYVETEYLFEIYRTGNLERSVEVDYEKYQNEIKLAFYIMESNWEKEYDFEVNLNEKSIFIEYEISFQGNDYDEGELVGSINTEDNKTSILFRLYRDDEFAYQFDIQNPFNKEETSVSFFFCPSCRLSTSVNASCADVGRLSGTLTTKTTDDKGQ